MSPKHPAEKKGSILVKVFVTAALILFLLSKTDINEMIGIIWQLNHVPLIFGIGLTLGAVVLSAYKWRLLLSARGWGLPLTALTKIYFVGLFMNNFLPSSMGGDLMRMYRVGKIIDNHSESAASVIVERLLATVGLILLAVCALIPNRMILGNTWRPLIICLALCLAVLYIFVNPAVLRPLTKLPWERWQKVVQKLKKVNAVIQYYRSKPGAVLKVIAWSVLFQLSIVFINYYLLHAMNIHSVSLWQCTLVVPLISAVSMIPVSINGLGIREGAYVVLFGPLGLSPGQAMTLSVLFFMIVTAVSLMGGLIFALDGGKEEFVVTKQ